MSRKKGNKRSHKALSGKIKKAWQDGKLQKVLDQEDKEFVKNFPRQARLLGELTLFADYMKECFEKIDEDAYGPKATYISGDHVVPLRKAVEAVHILRQNRGFLFLGKEEPKKVLTVPAFIGKKVTLTESGKRKMGNSFLLKRNLEYKVEGLSKGGFRVVATKVKGESYPGNAPNSITGYNLVPDVDFKVI